MKADTGQAFWELVFFTTLGLVIAAWLLPLLYWAGLPESIPIHFNARGEVDGMGSKYTLFLIPAIGSGVVALLGYVAKRPLLWRKYTYNARLEPPPVHGQSRTLEIMALLCAILFFFLQYLTIDAARAAKTPRYFWLFWVFLALITFAMPLAQLITHLRSRDH